MVLSVTDNANARGGPLGTGGEADPRAPPAGQATAQGRVPAAAASDARAARQGAGADQEVTPPSLLLA